MKAICIIEWPKRRLKAEGLQASSGLNSSLERWDLIGKEVDLIGFSKVVVLLPKYLLYWEKHTSYYQA